MKDVYILAWFIFFIKLFLHLVNKVRTVGFTAPTEPSRVDDKLRIWPFMCFFWLQLGSRMAGFPLLAGIFFCFSSFLLDF